MNHKSRIFDSKQHLTLSTLIELKNGSLSPEELILATTHISECLDCANAFSNSFADSELMDVPWDFLIKIENRLPRNKFNKNKDLFLYSLRVGVAVCASIAMIFLGTLGFNANIDTYTKIVKAPDLGFTQSINSKLRDFSQKILNMEVFLDETEER